MKRILILFLGFQVFLAGKVSPAQKVHRIIIRESYEEQILNGPYFGIPGTDPNEQVLIFRKPVGKVEHPEIF